MSTPELKKMSPQASKDFVDFEKEALETSSNDALKLDLQRHLNKLHREWSCPCKGIVAQEGMETTHDMTLFGLNYLFSKNDFLTFPAWVQVSPVNIFPEPYWPLDCPMP